MFGATSNTLSIEDSDAVDAGTDILFPPCGAMEFDVGTVDSMSSVPSGAIICRPCSWSSGIW